MPSQLLQRNARPSSAMMRAVRRDPHGDTVLAQISPQEAAMLAARGGAALPNPRMPEVTQFYSDSANEHSRATTGGNMADHSRPGGAGTQGGGMSRDQANAIMGMGGAPGLPSPGGPAPTFTHNQGVQGPRPGTQDRWGTTVGQAPDIQAQQTDYNNAADNMDNRGFGGWLEDSAKDLIPGFHQVTPQWNKPSTYADGIYHDAWSPLAAALGVAGSAAPFPGIGTLASKAGIAATNAFGLPDYTFGGGGGWKPDESNAIEKAFPAPAAAPAIPGSPASSQQYGPGNGATGGHPLLAPVPSNSPGAPGVAPGAPPVTPPPPGSMLPPTGSVQGGFRPVYGSYGWQMPSWSYAQH